jgi:CoA-disulfide reductase
MSSKKIIIVGGVAGGASCAARLRRLDENAEIIMFERGEHISFANCGLPYHIGEIIKDEDKLVVVQPDEMKKSFNIDVRIFNEVIKINRAEKYVTIRDLQNNNTYEEKYDKLVLSPGATPIRPPIPGINTSNIFTLRNIPDTLAIKSYIDNRSVSHAVVVGGGFIGIEMAENLVERGLKVTVVELAKQVMAPLDYEMAAYVHQHLKFKGVELYLSDGVKGFEKIDEKTTAVHLQSGKELRTNLIIFGVGVKPESTLASGAGLDTGIRGAIQVDSHLQTNDPDIFAIGDAIEIKDFVTNIPAHIPLAGPANKQGRIVANNICGIDSIYKGTQGTSIAKIFNLVIATTGDNEKILKKFNIPYQKSYTQNSSHAGYYPGAVPMSIKLLFSPDDGKILGAQIVGYEGVDKRIDVLATALRANMTVYDLEELELAYAPPFSSAKDPVNIAGFVAANILKGDMKAIYWDEIDNLDTTQITLLDVREEIEFKLGKIEGTTHIPLHELRTRYEEIPKEKDVIIYCQAGQRGYYAARILTQLGFNVKNLSGGYKAYTITTEVQSNEDLFDDMVIHKDDIIKATSSSDYSQEASFSMELDACGLACPGPIMKVAENLDALNAGEVLKIQASDPGFYSDIKVWADSSPHKLVNLRKEGSIITALIKKGIAPTPKTFTSGKWPDGKNIVVFSGDLDKVIAAFIIANGAAAMGRQVTMFFTFWGLNVLRKSKKVRVKKNFIEKVFGRMMPRGPKKLELSQMKMMGMGTKMIKKLMKKHNVDSLESLITSSVKTGVKLVACQMSMDLMGIKIEELIEGTTVGGVATMLGASDQSNMSMFI